MRMVVGLVTRPSDPVSCTTSPQLGFNYDSARNFYEVSASNGFFVLAPFHMNDSLGSCLVEFAVVFFQDWGRREPRSAQC